MKKSKYFIKYRKARLDGARFEAKKEIAKYREDEERKFREYIERVI